METILLAVSISCLVSVVTNLISVITVLVLAKKSKAPALENDGQIEALAYKLKASEDALKEAIEEHTPK